MVDGLPAPWLAEQQNYNDDDEYNAHSPSANPNGAAQ
jgi:hypothetical protein